jgi:hypothetical protein
MRIVRILRNLTFLTFLNAFFVGRLANKTKRIRIKSGIMDIRVKLETKRARVASHRWVLSKLETKRARVAPHPECFLC